MGQSATRKKKISYLACVASATWKPLRGLSILTENDWPRTNKAASPKSVVHFILGLNQGEGRGGGEETKSGTEKRCSHKLQSGRPAWWSSDNCSIFPAVNVFRLFRDKKRTGRGNQKCLKNWKNYIMHLCFSCVSYLSFGTEIAWETTGETKTQPC